MGYSPWYHGEAAEGTEHTRTYASGSIFLIICVQSKQRAEDWLMCAWNMHMWSLEFSFQSKYGFPLSSVGTFYVRVIVGVWFMDLDLKRNSHFSYANMHVSLKNDILGEFDNFFHGNKCKRLDELIRSLENYIPRNTETLDNSHSLRTFYIIES